MIVKEMLMPVTQLSKNCTELYMITGKEIYTQCFQVNGIVLATPVASCSVPGEWPPTVASPPTELS